MATSYFPSEVAAYRYYRARGYDIEDLYEMIAKRKICIGTPPVLPGQRLELIDDKRGRISVRVIPVWRP